MSYLNNFRSLMNSTIHTNGKRNNRDDYDSLSSTPVHRQNKIQKLSNDHPVPNEGENQQIFINHDIYEDEIHETSNSSNIVEATESNNIIELNSQQLLSTQSFKDDDDDDHCNDDEPQENQNQDAHDVALTKNQIITLATNLCHNINHLPSSSSRSNNNNISLSIPTPLIDLNPIDAYTSFQLSKNFLLQQNDHQKCSEEVTTAISILENLHHNEIERHYSNPNPSYGNGSNSNRTANNNNRTNHNGNGEIMLAEENGFVTINHNVGSGSKRRYNAPATAKDAEEYLKRRLSERHFPALIPPTCSNPKPRKRCYVCMHSKIRPAPKRTDTYYTCNDCNVPLCIIPCFNEYHTLINF